MAALRTAEIVGPCLSVLVVALVGCCLVTSARAVTLPLNLTIGRVPASISLAVNLTSVGQRCVAKYTCGADSSDTKECSCHQYCHLYDTCCRDIRPTNYAALRMDPSLYTCVSARQLTAGISVTVDEFLDIFVVNKCPSGVFEGTTIRTYCSHSLDEIWNGTLSAPVTHLTTGVTYRNMYCALCNGVTANDVVTWDFHYSCYGPNAQQLAGAVLGVLVSNGCMPGYTKPPTAVMSHDCRREMAQPCDPIDPMAAEVSDACQNGPTQYVYDANLRVIYRNRNCLQCVQSSSSETLSCSRWPTQVHFALPPPLPTIADSFEPPGYVCPRALTRSMSAEERAAWISICPDVKLSRGCIRRKTNRK